MTTVSPREEFAIRAVLDVVARAIGPDGVHDEESAWEALNLAAKMISYAMRKKMTAKSLRNKIGVLVDRDPKLQAALAGLAGQLH
jgi:hypothetical protein